MQKILALSSSRVGNGFYLETTLDAIKMLLGHPPLQIAFIPYAGVSMAYQAYGQKVQDALKSLGHHLIIADEENARSIVEKADAMMVGGGNTFKLLSQLYASHLLSLIKQRVTDGCPYVGWSAGANICGLGIGTTNDMPIIQPTSFEALGLFPFQINPHYYHVEVPGHNGETRDDRLSEFLMLHPLKKIVCLPEGTALLLIHNRLQLIGTKPAFVMQCQPTTHQIIKQPILPEEDISWLMGA